MTTETTAAPVELLEDGLVLLDHVQGATRFLATRLARVEADPDQLAAMAWLIADGLEHAREELAREREDSLGMLLEIEWLKRELAGEAEDEPAQPAT